MTGPAPCHRDTTVTVYHGDCLDVLPALDAGSVDAVITDPPYALSLAGREQGRPAMLGHLATGRERRGAFAYGGAHTRGVADSDPRAFQSWCTTWAGQCLRLLKPGGHLLAFGAPRTYHRLTAGIEDAGFEIRDSIAWLHGQGLPKSRNLNGAHEGWGTGLKPAHEPCTVARKPPEGTVTANVLVHGTGALHIDACRIPAVPTGDRPARGGAEHGRWPTNAALDATAAAELDARSGAGRDDVTGPSRFLPVFHWEPKAPAAERPRVAGVAHPTVKPLNLMRWLVRLVTPYGGTVLDPFAGSGTTIQAALVEGVDAIAVEREEKYLPLIRERIGRAREVPLDLWGGGPA